MPSSIHRTFEHQMHLHRKIEQLEDGQRMSRMSLMDRAKVLGRRSSEGSHDDAEAVLIPPPSGVGSVPPGPVVLPRETLPSDVQSEHAASIMEKVDSMSVNKVERQSVESAGSRMGSVHTARSVLSANSSLKPKSVMQESESAVKAASVKEKASPPVYSGPRTSTTVLKPGTVQPPPHIPTASRKIGCVRVSCRRKKQIPALQPILHERCMQGFRPLCTVDTSALDAQIAAYQKTLLAVSSTIDTLLLKCRETVHCGHIAM
ncbi:hypothetical protein BCR37DRAFT_385160 [Protomyces lactucae-debilis]|uniref:Uncharacterized protein n=1 Tax=Protomyces lactucae-debilis TaxID=2754530 RepID=A0A1Y2FV60_PROLT|nr:uncharacterized protein BCR37DRAFT_385160 [Protomyces lactucae-debilis]ORY87903.1 hypothetical protein BCR37DRAFT_385160 [Protomyces lactucae-debilis]